MSPRSRSAPSAPVMAGGAFVVGAILVLVFGGGAAGAIIGGVVAAGATWLVVQRRESIDAAQQQARVTSPAARRGTPRTLEPGDVVAVDDRMWPIEGTLRFDEGGFVWHEHLLVDGADRWWLSVEDDDGELELVRWERHRGLALDPTAPTVAHADVTYTFDERGTAAFTSVGSTGAPASGRADYADYADGDRRLGFERFGGDAGQWETSVGEVISEHLLEIYPGGETVTGTVTP